MLPGVIDATVQGVPKFHDFTADSDRFRIGFHNEEQTPRFNCYEIKTSFIYTAYTCVTVIILLVFPLKHRPDVEQKR